METWRGARGSNDPGLHPNPRMQWFPAPIISKNGLAAACGAVALQRWRGRRGISEQVDRG